MHHHTAGIHHLSLHTQPGAQLVVGIIVAYAHRGAMLLQYAVEQGIEHELRILAVVAYLSSERQPLLTLGEPEVDGV